MSHYSTLKKELDDWLNTLTKKERTAANLGMELVDSIRRKDWVISDIIPDDAAEIIRHAAKMQNKINTETREAYRKQFIQGAELQQYADSLK